MLYLVTGRIGSGKTSFIHELIEQFANGGEKGMTLIVPEQFSFETERMVLSRLGASGFQSVDVLSFSRLADKLVPQKIKSGKRPLDDASKTALMSLALADVRDRLEMYAGQVANPGVIKGFLSLYDELRQSCVTPEILRQAAQELKSGQLKRKLCDIAVVSEAYEAEQAQSYFDTSDMLEYLHEVIVQSRYFKNRIVFIDAFRGFTALELKIIERMLIDAKAVYVTLCKERPGAGSDTELFAHTDLTEKKLKGIARKNSISIIKPQNLSMGNKFNNFPKNPKRYSCPELAALETNLFDMAAPVYEQESANITLCTAPDIYSECEYVACTAKKLIREQGYRCRDIAVIARNSESYEAVLRTALRKCAVGVFDDNRQPVTASPLIGFVESAVAAVCEGFSTENVLRCIKTGLTSLSEDEISLIENYTYLWQINGSQWFEEWSSHPRGYGFRMDEDDADALVNINAAREKAIAPLLNLKRRIENANAADAAKAIYALLCEVNASENLKSLAQKLSEQGDEALALEQERLWNSLMEMLDSLAGIAGERTFKAKDLNSILSIMFSAQTLGTIPQGLDEVTVGSADRIRLVSPKVVFIVGANYGVFPAGAGGASALSDKDRKILSSMNIELASFGEYKIAEERLIAYHSFCAASDKLFVCCPASNASGEALEPSELVSRIEKLFPQCNRVDTTELDPMYFIESKQTAFERLAAEKNSGSAVYLALNERFGSDAEYAGRLAALERAGRVRQFEIKDKNTAKELFGSNMYLSASRAEKYYKCPFEYFCEYGMRAGARKPAQIDVLQRGTIVHYVLERLLSEYKDDSLLSLGKKERLDIIIGIMDEYLAELLGGAENKSPRFMHNYRLLARAINDMSQRLVEEFRVCSFRPVDFELKIEDDGEIPAYRLRLPEGESLKIHGSVDRVDCADINGEKFIRVIDYKSGGKAFQLCDVMNGLNMQMLIYLFAVWENSAAHYGDITPAGILYYPAKTSTLSVDRGLDEAAIQKEKIKGGRMTGVVLKNRNVVLAMDSDASGAYIPAKLDAKTDELTGSLVSLAEFAALKKKADSLLVNMACSLHDGKIEALPVKSKTYKDVCAYCDYKGICFHEEGIERREYESIPDSQVLEILTEGAQRNGED